MTPVAAFVDAVRIGFNPRALAVTTCRVPNSALDEVSLPVKKTPVQPSIALKKGKAVEDRAVPGHWEGDLLGGGRQSYVATLVERRSCYVCLVRLTGKDTQTVVQALTQHVQRLPAGLMATLTWDRGLELAAHRTFSIATGVQVYFCDPQSPWQRGINENTNGLLRQYLPKGTDFSGYTQAQLDAIARELNTRPRKTLGYRTPAATLAATVASTG